MPIFWIDPKLLVIWLRFKLTFFQFHFDGKQTQVWVDSLLFLAIVPFPFDNRIQIHLEPLEVLERTFVQWTDWWNLINVAFGQTWSSVLSPFID